MEKNYTVNSLNKALLLIEDLGEHGPSSLADLHQRLGLDKATMYRLLKTLKDRAFVAQSLVDHRYFNTVKMFQIGSREIDRGGLRELIKPYLKKLSHLFQEVAHMALRVEPAKAVCIDKIDSVPDPYVRFDMNLGSEVSFHASGMGKAILAFSGESQRELILSRLAFERFTPRSLRNPSALVREIKRVRRQGYAINDGETFEGLYCVAVPILNQHGEANASISITGPRGRLLEKKEAVVGTLLAHAWELSILNGLPPEQWPLKKP
ncbi:MAG: IclR family transcriptional regulator [Candidatus Adiutrix sp.]|jgi:IclR family acetate operon transcriptional repressor|nr:IclR family transcriptional regulator [Candidatus Adiutrix sp.]